MSRQRLDKLLVQKGLVNSRSQAENYIKLHKVLVDQKVISKPGFLVDSAAKIKLDLAQQYVSRAGLKLASVAQKLKLDFKDKLVLDVGSSTGGFSDFAVQAGARQILAVDVGTNQLHPNLRANPKVQLFEKTDIRNFSPDQTPQIVLIDVSFISLREILPHIAKIADFSTQIVAMVKPQFEAGKNQTNKGIIKNDAQRRQILSDFELWTKANFVIQSKRDSQVAGAKGNRERFYLLVKAKH